MTDAPPFTWADVEFLRREAARRERWAKTSRDAEAAVANQHAANRMRSLAERICERLKRGEAA